MDQEGEREVPYVRWSVRVLFGKGSTGDTNQTPPQASYALSSRGICLVLTGLIAVVFSSVHHVESLRVTARGDVALQPAQIPERSLPGTTPAW